MAVAQGTETIQDVCSAPYQERQPQFRKNGCGSTTSGRMQQENGLKSPNFHPCVKDPSVAREENCSCELGRDIQERRLAKFFAQRRFLFDRWVESKRV